MAAHIRVVEKDNVPHPATLDLAYDGPNKKGTMSLQPGTRLGPYEILAPLGAGGMGEVWKAKDTRLDRFVAVKVLPDHLAKHPESLARFEREAKAVAALNHPNITGIHDFATQGDTTYVVMELLEGESLRTRLESGPLAPRKATELAIQMAQGLAAAHEKGVVHRDLKPDNLWITKEGRLKILDFGLAKQLPAMGTTLDSQQPTAAISPGHHTEKGMILGTIGYMSPEQVRGESVDARSDIFSFGVVLLEMLTGKRAFARDTAAETMAAILKEEPRGLEGMNRTIPAGFHDLLDHCLEKEPSGRFQAARDLVYALQHADTPASPDAVRRGFPRHLRIAAMLLAALAFVGLGIALGYRRPNPLPTFTQLTRGRGTVSGGRFVPGSFEIVYSASWAGQSEKWYSRKLDHPATQVIAGGEGPLLSVSRDGEVVGLANAFLFHGQPSGRLYSLPMGGGSPNDWADNAWGSDQGNRSGDLACVLGSYGGEIRIEWPMGHPIYHSGRRVMKCLRVRGDQLVVFQEDLGIVEDGNLILVHRQGGAREISPVKGFTGLAWSPRGDEIWVSTFQQGQGQGLGQSRILALDLKGNQRVLLQHAGRLELLDVDPSGNALAALHTFQRQTFGHKAGETADHDLGWLEAQATMAITEDGGQVLLSHQGEWSKTDGPMYLRRIDGGPARRLGVEGELENQLSPDGKWVGAFAYEPGLTLILAPTGPGVVRRYPLPEFMGTDCQVHFLPDGNSVFVWGNRNRSGFAGFLLDPQSGALRQVTRIGTIPFLHQSVCSPDGRWIALYDATKILDNGTNPVVVSHPDGSGEKSFKLLARGDAISAWGIDSASLLVWDRNHLPARLQRVDLATGRRTPVLQVSPADPAGVSGIGGVFLAKDGRTYAYNLARKLSDLYLIRGLK